MSSDRLKVSRQDLRVLIKNMVYCSGIPSNLTSDQLKSESYFGKYGEIQKIIITPYPNRNYCSVYITYKQQFQAATAILSCNEFELQQSTLWCLFGTMKYCRFFLKKIQCKNIPNCPYLHLLDKKNEIQIKSSPSEAFPEHQKLAVEVLKKHPEKLKIIMNQKQQKGQLPSPYFCKQYLEQQKENVDENVENHQQNGNIEQEKQETVQEQEKQEIKKIFSLESCIKCMILNQMSRNRGSRLMKNIKSEEKNIKDIIILGLSK